MTTILGPVEVANTIKAKNNLTFPVVEDTDIWGGYQVVATTDERDSIPSAKLKVGMRVVVQANGNVYKLTSASPMTWEIDSGGGGSIGGVIPGATVGSVLFAGAGGALSQDNANFFWNDAANRLGLGTAAPSSTLHVVGGVTQSGGAYSFTSAVNSSLATTGTADLTISSDVGELLLFSNNGNLVLSSGSGSLNAIDMVSAGGVQLSAQSAYMGVSSGSFVLTAGATSPLISSVVLDSFGALVLDAYAASRFSTSFGDLTLEATGLSNFVHINSNAGISINAGTGISSIIGSQIELWSNGFQKFWPDAAGAANTVLRNDGTSQLTWGKVALTTDVSGILPVANGGTGATTAFTAGSIIFAGASGVYAQDNANLFWDDSNNRLGIGTASPLARLHSVATNATAGYFVGGTLSGSSATLEAVGDISGSTFVAQVAARSSLSNGTARMIFADTTAARGQIQALQDTAGGNSGRLEFYTATSGGTRQFGGAFDSSGRFGVGTSSPATTLDIVGTSAGASVSGGIRNTSTTGYSSFFASNDASTAFVSLQTNGTAQTGTLFGQTAANLSSVATAGAASSGLAVGTVNNTSLTFGQNGIERGRFSGTEFVVNDDGNAYNFRVESDGNANMLFVDASADKIGVGTNTPVAKLEVVGANFTTTPGFRAIGSSASTTIGTDFSAFALWNTNNTANNYVRLDFLDSGGFESASLVGVFNNDAQHQGTLLLRTRDTSGTTIARMTVGPSELVVNDIGNAYNFRVESDTNTHALFVDASALSGAGAVGIGTNAPASLFSVGASSQFQVNSTGNLTKVNNVTYSFPASQATVSGQVLTNDSTGNLTWTSPSSVAGFADGTAASPSIFFTADTDTGIYRAAANQLAVATAGVQRLLIKDTEAVFNDVGLAYNFRVAGDADVNAIFLQASTDRIGIGTASPTAKLDVAAGTVADGFRGLKVAGTLTNASSVQALADIQASVAGSGTTQLYSASVTLSGTATNNARIAALAAFNAVPGTGTSPTDLNGSSLQANYSLFFATEGATLGYNVGVSGYSANSTSRNYGIIGIASARTSGGATTNAIGVYGKAGQHTAGATGARVGGMFTLYDTDSIGTLVDAALIADNADKAAAIFLGRDNGTNVFTIANDGDVTIAPVAGHAGSALTVTGGSLASGLSALAVTGTLSSTVATQRGVTMFITGAGTGAQQIEGVIAGLSGGGYTGTGASIGANIYNESVGAGNQPFAQAFGNFAVRGQAYGASATGHNVGFYATAQNALRNFGFVSVQTTNSQTNGYNVGIATSAHNAASGGVRVGGFFSINTTFLPAEPTLTSAALIADNTSAADPIFIARDNGTPVFTIADGGAVTATSTITASNLSGTNTGDQTITLTSDVTGSGTGSFATTIAAGVVTNSKLANVATGTFKGRTTAGTGSPEDLTGTQATALLDVFSSTLKGLTPASGGGTTNYLRADGTWTTIPTSSLTGTLGVANGGTGTSTAFTPGSIVFAGTSGVYSQDNANLFWDDSNNRLGIGTASPQTDLHINQGAGAGGTVYLSGADVAHGMTSLVPTSVFGKVGVISATQGGLDIQGFNDSQAGVEGTLRIWGTIGDSNNANPVLVFKASATNGAGGRGDLASSRRHSQWQMDTSTTALMTLMANGGLGVGIDPPDAALDVSTSEAGARLVTLNGNGRLGRFSGQLNSNSSGTHARISILEVSSSTVSVTGAAVTEAAGFYVEAPTIAGASTPANTYALHVGTGNSLFDGNVGIGGNAASKFSVGATSQFQVNSTGNLTKVNNVTYSFPASQATIAGQVLSNDSTGNLTWVVPPALKTPISTKTANYTITTADGTIIVNAASGPVTITLPAAASATEYHFTVKKVDTSSNTVTIAGTIDGITNYVLYSQYEAVRVQSDGSAYWII